MKQNSFLGCWTHLQFGNRNKTIYNKEIVIKNVAGHSNY